MCSTFTRHQMLQIFTIKLMYSILTRKLTGGTFTRHQMLSIFTIKLMYSILTRKLTGGTFKKKLMCITFTKKLMSNVFPGKSKDTAVIKKMIRFNHFCSGSPTSIDGVYIISSLPSDLFAARHNTSVEKIHS